MNNIFKRDLLIYKKAQEQFDKDKKRFRTEIILFFGKYDIPVKVLFFGKTFGIDIDINLSNIGEVPHKIPVEVLYDFCKEFGCDFEETVCDGSRWIFSFEGMFMGY